MRSTDCRGWKEGVSRETRGKERRYDRGRRKESQGGVSLVVQWLRIPPDNAGMLVQSLALEDPTCLGQLSPCAVEPVLQTREASTVRGPRTTTRA